MIVDGLVPDPRRPGSTRVLIGGRPAWTVPADVVRELGLTEGVALSGDSVARLDAAAEEEGAVRSGMRSLERRAHGTTELSRKLERKGHPASAVAAAIRRLTALRLLDDLGFAREYVAARSRRGRGPDRLRHDLALLGIDREMIGLAVHEHEDGVEDPLAQPLALARKRAAQLRGLAPEARRRRLAAYLARRGFRGSEVRGVLESVLREG
ncbi:MAG: regulatory protein RecX [Gemmatimonadales bacterium]